MRLLGAVLLLGLGACSAASPPGLSLGAPEELHQRLLDRIAGAPEPEPVDSEFFSFPQRLPPGVVEIRIEGTIRGSGGMQEFQEKQPDYGLYANPIP